MMQNCKNCGTQLRDGARFCPVCGSPAGQPGQTEPNAGCVQPGQAGLNAGGGNPMPQKGNKKAIGIIAGIIGLIVVAVVLISVFLTGCYLGHDWQEADCTTPATCAKCGKTKGEALGHTWVDAACSAPKTCSVCGETKGEALGHTWAEATCTVPKTCSVCSKTEGDALGHSWMEATCTVPQTCSVCGETEGNVSEHIFSAANYQQAAACEMCGMSVGEPLPADFEKYNLTEHMVELDKEYDYRASCFISFSAETTAGRAIFSDYQTFDFDGYHEEKEGYEWKTVLLRVIFEDVFLEPILVICMEDYYDITKLDDTHIAISNQQISDNYGYQYFTVNWNGVDYTDCCYSLLHFLSFDGEYREYVEVLVPIGYDGFVLGVRTAVSEWVDGQNVFDIDNTDTLSFRMN